MLTRVPAETPPNTMHTAGAALVPRTEGIVLGLRPGLRCRGATICQSSLSASSGPLEDSLAGPSMPARKPSLIMFQHLNQKCNSA